jgi:hypothetical protein
VKNSYAFSNVVVKLCEIVACLSCIWREIKNGHYFLVAHCI